MAGDPAPWFHQRSASYPRYAFDTAGGRYIVLCFFASAGDPRGRRAVHAVLARRQVFDDVKACFFGVSLDPADEAEKRVVDSMPGLRFFWDFDAKVSKLYGAAASDADPAKGKIAVVCMWVVLDPTLRIMRLIPFAEDGSDADQLLTYVEGLPPPAQFPGFEIQAPILVLPNVFEPEFCTTLIDHYEAGGGADSGFMQEIDGKTVVVTDHDHKRRRDYTISDPELIRQTRQRVHRRIVPEILKVHQFKVTRMERYLLGCYTAEDRGHFRAHRDNTTRGTAHRRFAVSINLNRDFEGGSIMFPEYGPRGYKPPPGGAVVFSCSLLHAVTQVTRGRRYAFLPFLYDDEAARVREANVAFLGDGTATYNAALGTPDPGRPLPDA
jgi:predicted 2-oxoglutarate/Fe(II)-dependent dioxygenase YbiX/peroxiredoxin